MGKNHIGAPPFGGKAVASAGEARLSRCAGWLRAFCFCPQTRFLISLSYLRPSSALSQFPMEGGERTCMTAVRAHEAIRKSSFRGGATYQCGKIGI